MSVSDELKLFAQEIQSFLSSNILRDFARDVGFVQRTSKYQVKDLVALCVWMSQNVATTSLTKLSSCLEASTKVLISPEGLIPTYFFTKRGLMYPSLFLPCHQRSENCCQYRFPAHRALPLPSSFNTSIEVTILLHSALHFFHSYFFLSHISKIIHLFSIHLKFNRAENKKNHFVREWFFISTITTYYRACM